MKSNICLKLLLKLSIAGWISASVSILSPSYLATKYLETPIKHRVTSFSKVPYGHTVMGVAGIITGQNACQTGTIQNIDSPQTQTVILFVEDGGCSLPEKVLNAQKAGANLIVFVSKSASSEAPVSSTVDLSEIYIPSVTIYDSDIIQQIIREWTNQGSAIGVSVSFEVDKKDKPRVALKLDITATVLYDTLRTLEAKFQDIKNHISVEPAYNIRSAKVGDEAFCLNEKTYCEKRRDGKKVEKQEDQPLLETVRQICMLHSNQPYWWAYVKLFSTNCHIKAADGQTSSLTTELKKCSDNCVSLLPPDISDTLRSSIKECFDSIEGVDNNMKVKSGSKLLEFLQYNAQNRTALEGISSDTQETVMVNGQVMRGSQDSQAILHLICHAFTVRPDSCLTLEKDLKLKVVEKQEFTFGQAMLFILKLALIASIVLVAFYFCYKKRLFNQLQTQVSSHQQIAEADASISNYYMRNDKDNAHSDPDDDLRLSRSK